VLTLDVDLKEMRNMVRVTGKYLDNELEDLHNAFLMDLSRAGVNTIPEDMSLVKSCERMYLRWQQNYNGEAERYERSYKELRDALSLASEYKEGGDS
jgi:hypothetical protein